MLRAGRVTQMQQQTTTSGGPQQPEEPPVAVVQEKQVGKWRCNKRWVMVCVCLSGGACCVRQASGFGVGGRSVCVCLAPPFPPGLSFNHALTSRMHIPPTQFAHPRSGDNAADGNNAPAVEAPAGFTLKNLGSKCVV